MYILMVVQDDFPEGDAGAVRDLSFAKIYQKLGYTVFLVGAGVSAQTGTYEEIKYYSVFKEISGLKGHLYRLLQYPHVYCRSIESVIEKNGIPSAIHITELSSRTVRFLLRIAEQYKLPIMCDCVEWYSPCEFSLGALSYPYIINNLFNRVIIHNPMKVYSISSYLNEYFTLKNITSCRIPVIMDVINTQKSDVENSKKIKMIYAGSPANKDYFTEIIKGIENLSDDEKDRIEFNVFGLSKEEILQKTQRHELSRCIRAHGRTARDIVKAALVESDFSLLLRPTDERYVQAGFPTKSVEAMSHGVAMICNLSSDLNMYLKDMENAVIVNGYTAECLTLSIKRVLTLSREEINTIKRNARQVAEQAFDYRLYTNVIKMMLMGEQNGFI